MCAAKQLGVKTEGLKTNKHTHTKKLKASSSHTISPSRNYNKINLAREKPVSHITTKKVENHKNEARRHNK